MATEKTKAAMFFLRRQKVRLRKLATPRYEQGTLHTHFRPGTDIPQLVDADTPEQRVLTQLESDREAYEG